MTFCQRNKGPQLREWPHPECRRQIHTQLAQGSGSTSPVEAACTVGVAWLEAWAQHPDGQCHSERYLESFYRHLWSCCLTHSQIQEIFPMHFTMFNVVWHFAAGSPAFSLEIFVCLGGKPSKRSPRWGVRGCLKIFQVSKNPIVYSYTKPSLRCES